MVQILTGRSQELKGLIEPLEEKKITGKLNGGKRVATLV